MGSDTVTAAGGLELVPGYRFSTIQCGIRYEGRYDYSLIAADRPCNAAGVFTTNRVFAAPVRLCRERITEPVSGILINATNANACTGDEGYRNATTLTADIAQRLGVPPSSVLMASTGIIGRQLPAAKMLAAHPALVGGLSREAGEALPRAIMTTDTVPKRVAVAFPAAGRTYTVAGMAKGSGMIAPDMATLLAFAITDLPVSRVELDAIFRRVIGRSLNAITIDGDMSTNDTALVLAPRDGEHERTPEDMQSFEQALFSVMLSLAKMLVADGEGATKFITLTVRRARSDADARRMARSIAQSLLVKTAFFGNDPNWGRIACAAGYSGAALEVSSLSIFYGDIPLLVDGVPQELDAKRIEAVLKERELSVLVDAGLGDAEYTMYTTDISYDYVKINAQYST